MRRGPVSVSSIDEIIAQAGKAGLFSSRRPLKGCTTSEIRSLERRYGVSFPSDYRRFLELAGHGSGFLFRWDHFSVSLAQVTSLTEQEQARLREAGSPPLPEDAFIICGRLSEQVEFIRTEKGDASPVWYYAEGEPVPVVEYSSVTEWLPANLRGALEAQESGYFARHPEGCEP